MLKAELELALRPDAPREELAEALVSAGEETDRLARLAEDLLVLARGEDGAAPRDLDGLDCATLAERDAGARFGAEDGVDRSRSRGPACRARARRLDRALTNLVDNALRYGAGRSRSRPRATASGSSCTSATRAAASPTTSCRRAFERFSRAGGRALGGGAGLGLALVERGRRRPTAGPRRRGERPRPAAPTSGSGSGGP